MKARSVCALVVFAVMFCLSAAHAQQFTAWDNLINAGWPVNTEYADTHPALSKDGLSLYFNADQSRGTQGGRDLWVVRRATVESPWLPATNLGAGINTSAHEENPFITVDGHHLLFGSNRAGCGGFDIYVSWRRDKDDDLGWEEPMNLGCAINTAADETSPALFTDEETGTTYLYFSRQMGSSAASNLDLFVSVLQPDGTFGTAVALPSLNSLKNEDGPVVSRDGLDLYFNSNRLVDGVNLRGDIYVSHRASTAEPWPEPSRLEAPVNTDANEVGPALSWDGTELFFGAAFRPGNTGGTINYDIWKVSRTKMKGK